MTNDKEIEKRKNRNVGFFIFFLFMGFIFFDDIKYIFASTIDVKGNSINDYTRATDTTTTQEEQGITINNIENIYNGNSDCIEHPDVYDYRELATTIRQSQCYKDFLSGYPNDRQTTKVKSITITLMCRTGTSKGTINGKVVLLDVKGNTIKNYVLPITITDKKVDCGKLQDDKYYCIGNDCLNAKGVRG